MLVALVARAIMKDNPLIRVNGEIRYSDVLDAARNRKLSKVCQA
jgi:hypothetical protein